MNFQFLVEKLHDSDIFKKFKKEFPESYMCGGFFLIDRENLKNPENKTQLDYYVPSSKQIFSFKIDGNVEKTLQEIKDQRIPGQVSSEHGFDFEEIEDIIEKEMKSKDFNNIIKKFIFSFQSLKGNDYLIGTIFLNNLALLKVQINLNKMKLEELERKNVFDFFKKVK